MRAETVVTAEGKRRYMLVDGHGEPVVPVLRFLKFKDSSGAAGNTLRAYCQQLKLFFEFLETERPKRDYRKVTIDDMADFLRWLQSPYRSLNVRPLRFAVAPGRPRKPSTVNTVIGTVLQFYDYLMRQEDYSIQLSERVKKTIPGSRRGFKGFLHHITKTKDYPAKLLKVKQPRRRPKTLTKDQVGTLLRACSNLRDRFLLQLLWESGMRIGEALALWLEDVEIDAFRVHIRNRGELVNGAEIKTVCSPRTIDVSPELVNLFSEYVTAYFSDEVDTNHVFIKLAGANQHHPMDYPDVVSLFRRLRGKTGIYVSAHMFRHTSLTELKKAGWSAELLRRRAGHANVQTTQQMYIHPSDEEVREQWEKTRKQMRVKDGWKERDTP